MAVTTIAHLPATTAASPREQWWTRLRGVVGVLDGLLGELDAQRCDGEGALELLRLFARVRKAGAAGEALVAARVEESGAHRRTGHRSTVDLVASVAGTGIGEARAVVETGRALRDRSATDAALRAGTVSVEQAHAVTAAAAADPSAERALLERAGSESVRRLHDRARDVRLAAEGDRLGRYERQRAARSLRHGRDDEGMVWGRFRLPPDAGAAVLERLERQADREVRAARRQERREEHDRYLADALVTLCTAQGAPARVSVPRAGLPSSPGAGGGGAGVAQRALDLVGSDRVPDTTDAECGGGEPGDGAVVPPAVSARRADVVVHVSYEALRRGRVEGDERCAVQGAGQVPVEVPRGLLADGAFLKGVLVDGTDVLRVRHFGRHRPADLQTALEVRAVLRDGDVMCAAEGCDRRLGLDWDHERPLAAGGATSYENLRPLCRPHHRAKSAADRVAADAANRAPP